jgi:hypothetical protein
LTIYPSTASCKSIRLPIEPSTTDNPLIHR